jgi:hypothetical protein
MLATAASTRGICHPDPVKGHYGRADQLPDDYGQTLPTSPSTGRALRVQAGQLGGGGISMMRLSCHGRPLRVLAGYVHQMTEEWRVSLIFNDRPGHAKRAAVRDLLRRRLGDDVTVSGEKTRIFLYASAANVAEEAEYAARDVLAQQSLSAAFLFERWDPIGRAWRDARAEPSETVGRPAEDEDKRGNRAAKLIGNVILPYIDQIPPV